MAVVTADEAAADVWTLEALTADLSQDLAPTVARRGIRFVLYHDGNATLAPDQARRARKVLGHALTSAIGSLPAGTALRVDVACLPSLDGGRWLQAHATAEGATVLWMAVPIQG